MKKRVAAIIIILMIVLCSIPFGRTIITRAYNTKKATLIFVTVSDREGIKTGDEYSYDSDGYITKVDNYQYKDGKQTSSSTNWYIYDSQNNYIDDIQADSQPEISYDTNLANKTEQIIVNLGDEYVQNHTYEVVYDNAGRIIQNGCTEIRYSSPNNYTITDTKSYTYDQNGNITKEKLSDVHNNNYNLTTYTTRETEYKYNEDNILTESEEKYEHGQGMPTVKFDNTSTYNYVNNMLVEKCSNGIVNDTGVV